MEKWKGGKLDTEWANSEMEGLNLNLNFFISTK